MFQKRNKQASDRDLKYQAIMRNLVRRYVTQEQRKAENEGVTEDDVNEIKNDISAFRYEKPSPSLAVRDPFTHKTPPRVSQVDSTT